MKKTRSKRSIALILAIALLVGVLFNNANRGRSPSLGQRSAVLSGDYAVLRVMPSGFTASMGVCWRGQRLVVWMPPIFEFHRANCNGIEGFIASEQITVVDRERAD